MADNNNSHPSSMADSDFQNDDLWLVSYADDDDRELNAMQIAAALERGEIDANTIVWRDGMPEWKAIAEVEGLRAQLRRLSNAPENLRRRQTQLGGFGPVQTANLAASPAAPGLSLDDDEPTVIQSAVMEGFSSAPNHVRPESSLQRGRHPTSGNTLRIKTGEPPQVAPRVSEEDRITPNDFSRHAAAARLDSSPRASAPSDPDLESLPSALLVTATNTVEVSHKPGSGAPPTPTRGVMSRQSDPPGTPLNSKIPRAALTRDPDSDAPPAPKRTTDAPKPPTPRKAATSEPESIPPEAVKSVVSTPGVAPTPSASRKPEANLPSVQVRDEDSDLSRQRTRPPRSRREGWVESGTPPPIGELSEAAARIAQATSHAPPAPLSEAPAPKPSSGSKWIGLALFGAAAVAGAFALGKRSGEQSPTPNPLPPTTTASALAAAPLPKETAAPPTPSALEATEPSAIVPEDEAAPAPAAKPAPKPQNPAPTPVSPAPRPEPKAAPKVVNSPPANATAAPASPAAASATEPPAEKATAPSGAFDASAAAAALGAAASRASSCRQPGDPSGVARVTVTFTNSGNATHAIVDGPPFAGTPTGGCIASTMRGATVPPFTGERVTVKKTVVIQ